MTLVGGTAAASLLYAAAGGYTVWRDRDTLAGQVTITTGQVPSFHW